MAALIVAAVGLAPTPAAAKRLGSDKLGGLPVSSCDPSHTVAPDVSAFAGELYNAEGRVLWSRRATEAHPMASTTKIMTALLALERCDPEEVVVVSKRASSVSYALGLQAGERFTVRELIEFALVGSSNDAALALAEHISGSAPAFVALMNERAEQLDLDATHYANPHGLDAPGHHMSAADLGSLTATAMRHAEFRRIVGLKSVTLAAHKDRPAREVKSTNQLLRTYPGTLGGKTGFTDDAKYTLVTTARRHDVTLTAVVMGAPSSAKRFKHTARLLDWGFQHYRLETLATPTETVGTVPVSADSSRGVPVRFAEKTAVPVFDLDGPVRRELGLAPTLPVPVFEGQPAGFVRLVQGERQVATVTVVAATDVASAGEVVGAVPVADYLSRTVTARADVQPAQVEEYDPSAPVDRNVDLDPSVTAPVVQGARVGEIVYSQGGRVICRVPAIAAAAVESPGPVARLGIWIARGLGGLVGAPRMAALEVVGS